ncbi:unnamed protein product [Clonostachys rosea]|uniref:Secreted protein n=1 Tax=Bionectria ochroleuca TaxID=29856 RepID=A0ABY6TYY9_BIOOC|nr:unnamed protein product [Clonostachys rosea]
MTHFLFLSYSASFRFINCFLLAMSPRAVIGSRCRSNCIAVPFRSFTQAFPQPEPNAATKRASWAGCYLRIVFKDTYNLSHSSYEDVAWESRLFRIHAPHISWQMLSQNYFTLAFISSLSSSEPLCCDGASTRPKLSPSNFTYSHFELTRITQPLEARIPTRRIGLFGSRFSTRIILGQAPINTWIDHDTTAWFGRNLGLFPTSLNYLTSLPKNSFATVKFLSSTIYSTDFPLLRNLIHMEVMET